jgi:hypothetical protein
MKRFVTSAMLGALGAAAGVYYASRQRTARRVDKLHDKTVKDSFPASDPPSSWASGGHSSVA